jgi:SAM-dependent methyltransferase
VTALRTRRLDACPLCDSPIARRAFTLPDRLHGVPGEFSYDRCGDCGTVYQNPQIIPKDLPRCYPSDYYTHAASTAAAPGDRAPSETRRRLRDAIARARRGEAQSPLDAALGRLLGASRSMRERAFYGLLDELIPRRPEGGRALEIGCGAGHLLALLHRNGWRAEGVEWDAAAADAVRERTGLPVRVGDYARLDLPQQEYDLVVLQHVFEHLPDPGNALRLLGSLVRPKGLLVLIFPNPRGLGARLFGRNWFHWDVPRHLVIAPSRIVARAGSHVHLSLVSRRTVTRPAEVGFVASRAFRLGLRVQDVRPNLFDTLAARASAVLAVLGLGEEIVIVFEPADRSMHEGRTR